jgi:hypothetical protein
MAATKHVKTNLVSNTALGKVEGVLVGKRCYRSTFLGLLLFSEGLVVHELVHLFSFQNIKVRIVRVHHSAEIKVLLHLWFVLFFRVFRIIVFQQSPDAFLKFTFKATSLGCCKWGGAGAGRRTASALSWVSRNMVNRLQT